MTLGSKQRRAKWGTLTAPRTPKKADTATSAKGKKEAGTKEKVGTKPAAKVSTSRHVAPFTLTNVTATPPIVPSKATTLPSAAPHPTIGRITAPRRAPKRVRVKEGMTISFSYKKLDGDLREVHNFAVDNVFDSKAGHRIIQGWREDGVGHSYRRYRMSGVSKAADEHQ